MKNDSEDCGVFCHGGVDLDLWRLSKGKFGSVCFSTLIRYLTFKVLTMLRLFVFLALMLIPKGWASQQKVLLQSDSNPFTREFEKLANETLAHWHVPGLSIGIVDGENEWSAVSFSKFCYMKQ